MTIAIAVKVHDGVVLATDSASTLLTTDHTGNQFFENLYNNGNKLFNLVKGVPIGAMSWGSGSMGVASIATLMKDLRREMGDEKKPEWYLAEKAYTVEEAAKKVKKFFEDAPRKPHEKPTGGILVAGYSAVGDLAESWLIEYQGGVFKDPVNVAGQLGQEAPYILPFGQPESVMRLVAGFSPAGLVNGLKECGIADADLTKYVQAVQKHSLAGLINSAMPIQDTIDLAEFLVHMASQYTRFVSGPATVGGPIDVAAITKHEGFKWIKRKYYFPRSLNPEPRNLHH